MWYQLCDILAYCSPIGNNTSPCMFVRLSNKIVINSQLNLCLIYTSHGCRATASSTIFRTIVQASYLATTYGFTLYTSIVRFVYELLRDWSGQIRTKVARRLQVIAQSPQDFSGSFFATTLPKNRVFASRSSRGLNRCPCEEWNNARTICLRTTGLRVLTLVQRFFI